MDIHLRTLYYVLKENVLSMINDKLEIATAYRFLRTREQYSHIVRWEEFYQ